MSTVIKVDKVAKKYLIGNQKKSHDTLRDVLMEKVKAPFKWMQKKSEIDPYENNYFWALKDISFEVGEGEVVGIIGRNGAGKSTFLKILSKITEPTEGQVKIKGRVASLLEVGTGFHPELSGRENVFLNGAILGMSRKEISRKFDEIVEFSEIAKFLDTPVKRYSSGMYVRLAFAVAAHLEPEILIVDEVLAVGDASFQKKCLGKMQDVSKGGRTVLFVSHNMGAISRLCKSAVWLNSGRVACVGAAHEVIQQYQAQHMSSRSDWRRTLTKRESTEFSFVSVEVKNGDGKLSSMFNANEGIFIEISYLVKINLTGCQVGVRVCNSEGVVVFTTADSDDSNVSALPKKIGFYRARFTIPPNFLSPGSYYLTMSAHLPRRTIYETIEQSVTFTVSTTGWLGVYDGRPGLVSPVINWQTLPLTMQPNSRGNGEVTL